MGSSEDTLKRWNSLILLILIIFTLINLGIFGILAVYINQGRTCGVDRQGVGELASTSNSSYVLNNGSDYLLQQYQANFSDQKKHTFCYDIHVNNSAGEKIEVINENLTVLGVDYALTGLNAYCTRINLSKETNYIGLRCPACTTQHTILLMEATAGDSVKQVYNNAGITVYQNTTLSNTLYSSKTCKSTARFFLWLYLIITAALCFLMLIIVGFKRFEHFIFNDFPKLD